MDTVVKVLPNLGATSAVESALLMQQFLQTTKHQLKMRALEALTEKHRCSEDENP
jgi:hypothetical protein